MRKYIILILLCLVTLILSNYFLVIAEEKQSRNELIIFSHQFHIEDAEVACEDCHKDLATSSKAEDRNFPDMDVCSDCHDVEDDETCEMCHPDMDNLEAVPNPDRKYHFNHQKHVVDEKMNCEKCHPDMNSVILGDGNKIPNRASCNACHNGLAVSMECYLCHSNDTNLRPDDHNPGWTREHMVQIRAGETNCTHCHTNNYCQECHEPTDLISTKILPENFYASYSPSEKGEKGLILKTVHELNYRFVHQLDAMGKEKDCQVCHETSFYCAECHSGSDVNPQIRPGWHDGLDWGALASVVGSGGGRHAELARRDIERCAACHDVQGADPVCLMCHVDFDGIKNTDPKTHESGFSNRFGESSEFHDDDGAVCFTCHTNTKQKGQGFCVYCHD